MKALVISLRGLPASATGPYGNRWVETPTFDALAAQGVVFDWHLAAHPEADTARRVWRTGCYHFPKPEGEGSAVGPWPDLLAVLKAQGVSTHLIHDDSHPAIEANAPGWGQVECETDPAAVVEITRSLIAGLEGVPSWLVWVDLGALLPPWWAPDELIDAYFASPVVEEEDEPEVTDEEAGAEYLDEEDPVEPLFDPPEGAIDPDDDVLYLRIQKTFAAALTTVDSVLGDLLEGLADDVHVVVTSDHGQALGEHGVVGPVRPWLHDEVVRVPLILYGPGCPPGRHVPALTASVDLAPTLAEMAGASLDGAHGHSLLGLARALERSVRDYICLGLRIGEEIEWGLRSADRLLRLPIAGDDRPKLFVKPDDHCEVNDVLQHHLEQAEALEQTLRAFVAACDQPGPLEVPPLPDVTAVV